MKTKQAAALFASLVVKADCSLLEEDTTSLLQRPVRRSQQLLQVQHKGAHLLETAHTIISKINAGDDPSGCGLASDAARTVVEETLPAIVEQVTRYGDQIRIAARTVTNCASQGGDLAQQGDDLETARADHQTCRLAQPGLEDGLEACRQYEALRNSVGNRCFTFPNDESDYPEAVQQAKDELNVAFDQAVLLRENCNSAREAIATEEADCEAAQLRFEEGYCTYRSVCTGVQECLANTEETYSETVAEIRAALETLYSEYQTIKHVECLLDHADQALEQSIIVSGEEVSACSEPASTDALTIDFPTVDAVTTCESHIISRPPCTGEFFEAEYRDLPEREAIQAACISCPGAQTPPPPPQPDLPRFHFEPEASNTCSTESVTEEECREAVQVLLPEHRRSATALHASSWAHLPSGCAVNNDNFHAYFNRHAAGSNNGHYSPVCMGPQPTSSLVAHLEPRASNACSTGSVSEAECLEAVRLLLPEGQTARGSLSAASWAHLPVGCAMNMNNWGAYFNRRDAGSNNGAYSPVCTGPGVVTSLVAHLETQGSNACSTAALSEAECLEAVRLVLPEGQRATAPAWNAGSWAHLPSGCALNMNNWNAYFNRLDGGSNNGHYSPVCAGPEQASTLIAHLEPQGSNACSTDSVTELECLEAVRLLLPAGRTERGAITASSWAHLPVGCSMNMDNWNPYFNRASSGSNNGHYSPVCIGPEMTGTLVAHLDPVGSNACSTESMSEGECLEAVRLLLPDLATQANPALSAGSWAHLPVGCSMNNDNWGSYFNRRNAGSNNGRYSPVCAGALATTTLVAHLETQGSNACSTASMSEAECLEAVRLVLPEAQRTPPPAFTGGSWAHLPSGCALNMNNWDAYFNRRDGGSNNGHYSPVCAGPEQTSTLIAHLGVAASDACDTASVTAAECLEAVRAVMPPGQSNGAMSVGAWAHVPTGCAVHNTNKNPYFNTRASGSNNGAYTPVCSGESGPQNPDGMWELVGNGPCRNPAGTTGEYILLSGKSRDQCRADCAAEPTCLGYESRNDGRCELHTDAVVAVASTTGRHECWSKNQSD